MIVNYHPSASQFDDGARRGHYFSCDTCGWCSPIYTGDESRLQAVLAARRHAQAKAAAARQHVRPTVVERHPPYTTPPGRAGNGEDDFLPPAKWRPFPDPDNDVNYYAPPNRREPRASRCWKLATLAFTLATLGLGLLLNALRRVLHS